MTLHPVQWVKLDTSPQEWWWCWGGLEGLVLFPNWSTVKCYFSPLSPSSPQYEAFNSLTTSCTNRAKINLHCLVVLLCWFLKYLEIKVFFFLRYRNICSQPCVVLMKSFPAHCGLHTGVLWGPHSPDWGTWGQRYQHPFLLNAEGKVQVWDVQIWKMMLLQGTFIFSYYAE